MRALALIDHENTSFFFYHHEDVATPKDREFRAGSEQVARLFRARTSDSSRPGAPTRRRPVPRVRYVLPLLLATRSIVTIHDHIHLRFPQYLTKSRAVDYAHFMKGSAIRRAHVLFTVSEASKRDILHFFPRTDPTRTSVVTNAIDADLPEASDQEAPLTTPFLGDVFEQQVQKARYEEVRRQGLDHSPDHKRYFAPPFSRASERRIHLRPHPPSHRIQAYPTCGSGAGANRVLTTAEELQQ